MKKKKSQVGAIGAPAHTSGFPSREELLEAEAASYHAAGTCTFYGTANSNQLLMEAMGLHPRLVPGGAQNFKVTYPDDFALAAAVLAQRAHGATLDRFGGARGQVAPAVGKKTMF